MIIKHVATPEINIKNEMKNNIKLNKGKQYVS